MYNSPKISSVTLKRFALPAAAILVVISSLYIIYLEGNGVEDSVDRYLPSSQEGTSGDDQIGELEIPLSGETSQRDFISNSKSDLTKPAMGQLTVKVTPSDARVRITNIEPRYRDQIELELNNFYDIVVTKTGYESYRKSIRMSEEMQVLHVVLDRHVITDSSTKNSIDRSSSPALQSWSRYFGGEGRNSVNALIPASGGGYLLGGYNLLIKVDEDGHELWSSKFGGRSYETLNAIIPAKGGGYLLGGNTESEPAEFVDGWLIKVDEDGHELWSRTFGGKGIDSLEGLIPASSGGYLLSGYTAEGAGNYDGWLIKVDEYGRELWSRTFGGENQDWLKALIPAYGGGYLLSGHTYSEGVGNNDGWLIKVDEDGRELWSRTFGGESYDYLNALIPASGGGYLLSGFTQSKGAGDQDGWLIKVDEDGHELWSNTFGGEESDRLEGLIPASGGGYLLIGYTGSKTTEDIDGWLIKVDEDGRELWSRTFGGKKHDRLKALIPASGGGYLLSGFTQSGTSVIGEIGSRILLGGEGSKGWLVKVDEEGK